MSKAEVFSSGGGTQSCAIAALIIQGKLPKPDFAVIADTGRERSTTWEYMDRYVAPALASIGVVVQRVRATEWATMPGEFDKKGDTLLIPAFSDQCGQPGKMPGFCSSKWKGDVIDRWLSQVHGVKRSKYRKWIGFSLDETARACRMMRSKEWRDGGIRFPLIYDIPLRRQQSIDLVKEMGWPEPPRSNCYMCPNQSDAEWRDLKNNHPEEFQKAVELEREIRERDPFAWLYKSCKPLDTVDFSQPEDLFSRACDSGACFI